jgi:hypothetical protein
MGPEPMCIQPLLARNDGTAQRPSRTIHRNCGQHCGQLRSAAREGANFLGLRWIAET